LVDETELSANWYPGNTDEKPDVIRAVWIDGGMPHQGDGNIDDLDQFFSSIPNHYNFSDQYNFRDKKLQFDAIVISKIYLSRN
jgi:uncharacterized protein (DUF2267 family)